MNVDENAMNLLKNASYLIDAAARHTAKPFVNDRVESGYSIDEAGKIVAFIKIPLRNKPNESYMLKMNENGVGYNAHLLVNKAGNLQDIDLGNGDIVDIVKEAFSNIGMKINFNDNNTLVPMGVADMYPYVPDYLRFRKPSAAFVDPSLIRG